MDVLDRFISYAEIDTQSSEDNEVTPSTMKQFDLGKKLRDELTAMGASDVKLTKHCYVYARIPSNLSEEENAHTPVLALISHIDTSPSASGQGVKPRLIKNYDGGDIKLGNGLMLSPKVFPKLKDARGDDLLVTDGTTLLGADDKAGVAEIMQMAETLLGDPSRKHGEIVIGFTPDEEIGSGADYFDVKASGAEVGYTVDGGTLGGIEYENFNAASGEVSITGVSVHPGDAKGKMVNACLEAMKFNALLPNCIPANTEGYEGFFHLCSMSGNEASVKMSYIIRDHDREKFEEKKRIFQEAAEKMNQNLDGTGASVSVKVDDSYYNMKEKIEPYMYLVDTAKQAFREEGVTPVISPIRGGTDGAKLSFRGLPCPNLSTGGENYHGVYEYLNVNSLRKMVAVLCRITELMVGKKA